MELEGFQNLDDAKTAIEVALSQCDAGREEWIQGTLELANVLCRTKARFPKENSAFGEWLDGAGFRERINHQDRAALINIGRQAPAMIAGLLRGCTTTSWQLAWNTVIKPVLEEADLLNCQDGFIAGGLTSASKTPQTKADQGKPSNVTHLDVVKQERSALVKSYDKIQPNAPMAKMKRSEEIGRIFHDSNSRVTINEMMRGPGKREIWALLLECLDAGFYPEPVVSGIRATNLRFVFPKLNGHSDFSKRYDLTSARSRERIRAVVIPAIKARLDECLRAPDRVEKIVRDYEQAQRRVALETSNVEELKRRRQPLPEGQQEIMFYGRRLWPLTDAEKAQGGYDFTTLAYALRWFSDLKHEIEYVPGRDTAYAQALMIRLHTRYPMQYADMVLPPTDAFKANAMFQTVHLLCGILEETKGEGECSAFPLINDIKR